MLQAAPTEKREHLYKVLVIGELGTGKTSIIKRYVHQFFSQHYRATVSFSFLKMHFIKVKLCMKCIRSVEVLDQFVLVKIFGKN